MLTLFPCCAAFSSTRGLKSEQREYNKIEWLAVHTGQNRKSRYLRDIVSGSRMDSESGPSHLYQRPAAFYTFAGCPISYNLYVKELLWKWPTGTRFLVSIDFSSWACLLNLAECVLTTDCGSFSPLICAACQVGSVTIGSVFVLIMGALVISFANSHGLGHFPYAALGLAVASITLTSLPVMCVLLRLSFYVWLLMAIWQVVPFHLPEGSLCEYDLGRTLLAW